MMFGTRDPFLYLECAACGSLQIASLPDEMTLQKYYPSDYYSYSSHGSASWKTAVIEWLAAQRNRHVLGRRNPVGAVLQRMHPAPSDIRSLAQARASWNDRILDVGCGSGANLLNRLSRLGFKNLVGSDPFIAGDILSSFGVPVLQRDLPDMEGPFDIIMFHHSLEHVPEPVTTLTRTRELLRPGGRCIIRIPTPSSEAFQIYGANWVNLDPPRHLVLISREGMNVLAGRCGFVVEESFDDSMVYQFLASELYARDVPLVEQNKAALRQFDPRTVREYRKRTRRLNLSHRGDMTAFILRTN